MKCHKHYLYVLSVFTLVVSSLSVNAYTMRVDRFDVNGVVIDDFDDGNLGGWTNNNGIDTFGVWQDEAGTSFARLESPGLVGSSDSGANAITERSDIFSHLVPGGSGVGNGPFDALLTLDSVLPAVDQTYFFALNHVDPVNGLESLTFSITNHSPELAALGGLTPGLNFGQFRVVHDAALNVIGVTDVLFTPISLPAVVDTVQIAMQYDHNAELLIGSYMLNSSDGFVAPFAGIDGAITNGFWDIGTAETTIVPLPASIWLLISGLLGMITTLRKRQQ